MKQSSVWKTSKTWVSEVMGRSQGKSYSQMAEGGENGQMFVGRCIKIRQYMP